MCVCVYLLWFLILDGRFFLLCWYSTNISKFIKIYTEFGFKKRMTVILLTVPEMCLLQLSPHWYGTECCWWLTWLLFRFWTTIYPYWSGVAPKLAPWSKSSQNLAWEKKSIFKLHMIEEIWIFKDSHLKTGLIINSYYVSYRTILTPKWTLIIPTDDSTTTYFRLGTTWKWIYLCKIYTFIKKKNHLKN